MVSANDLKEMFVKVFGDTINVDDLDENSDLRADAGMNSISFLYMAMVVEEKYGIQFTNSDFVSLKTVKDVIEVIEKKAQEK